MTSHEFLTLWINDPTASRLSNIASDHQLQATILPDPLDGLDAIGYAAVPVDDGLLLIPYTAVLLGHGWEQFDLGHTILVVEPPTFPDAVAAYDQAERRLVEVLTDAIQKNGESQR